MKPGRIRLPGLALVLGFVAAAGPGASSGGWTLQLDIEDGAPGSEARGRDAFDDAVGRSVYSAERQAAGKQAARLAIREGSEGWDEWGGRKFFPHRIPRGGEVWLRVRVYWPPGFDWSADPWLKFLRVHTRSPGADEETRYDDWYLNEGSTTGMHRFISDAQDLGRDCGGTSHDPRHGVWESYQMYLRFDSVAASAGGAGLVRLWKGSDLLCEIRDMRTLRSADSFADASLFGTYWNGTAPASQHMFLDDVVITTRVPSGRDGHGNPMIPSP
jgi:hypothetical protein